MQNFFSCFCHFLVDLGALVHRKKFQSFRPSILESQAAEVALFRVLPVKGVVLIVTSQLTTP